MANINNTENSTFWDRLPIIFNERLKEMGITKYALCRDNNFNRTTCDSIVRGQRPVSVTTLLKYLDAVGLELEIKKKENESD